MLRWLTDTLAKRFFILMWLALVTSHVIAFVTVRTFYPGGPPGVLGPGGEMPTFPSLPPTPGLPNSALDKGPLNDPGRPPIGNGGLDVVPGGPPLEPLGVHRSSARSKVSDVQEAEREMGMPLGALLLDYFVRLIVIAAAAFFGSRLVTGPMRSLVTASQSLAAVIDSDDSIPPLDVRRGTREVRATAEVFNAMALQIKAGFRSRGLLYAAVSHDLRTPLTRLRLRLESSTFDESAKMRCVADIMEMDRLINGVIELARSTDLPRVDSSRNIDLGSLVGSMVDDLVEQGRSVSFTGGSALLRVPEPALRRIVDNLIGNALRYAGEATVSIVSGSGDVRVVVEDNGPGVPEDQIEAVFNPFVRVDTAPNDLYEGTGLGLFITRDLLNKIGGRVTLKNRLLGGLRVEAIFPI